MTSILYPFRAGQPYKCGTREGCWCGWFPHFFNNRGTILRALAQTGRALQDFTEAVKLNPRYPEAVYNRALVLERISPREALQAWESYLPVAREVPAMGDKIPEIEKRISFWKSRIQ
jgi:tetratricopeptide (TPR) repeat protein